MKRELKWIAPALPHQPFVLQAQTGPIGWLLCRDEAGQHAEGELDGRRAVFTRTSDSYITIEAGDVTGRFADGVASFSNGARYQWHRHHIWGAHWCFRNAADKSAVCVEQESGALQSGGKVSLCCAATQPETPILVLLAWYLRVLAFERLVTHADVRLPVF